MMNLGKRKKKTNVTSTERTDKLTGKRSKKLTLAQKIVLNSILVVCVGAIVFSVYMILDNQRQETAAASDTASYINLFNNPPKVDPTKPDPYAGITFPTGILNNFKVFYAMNKDIVGWVDIEGLKNFSYPIVQTKDNDKYYRTNFEMKSSREGTPFVDYHVNLAAPDINILIHGHNNKNGLMFGPLEKYNALLYGIDQYKAAPVITYYTLTQKQTYKIVAMDVVNLNWSDGPTFNFLQTDLSNPTDFNSFRNQVMMRSVINTGLDFQYGDTLLTLHTCAYYFKGSHVIIVARKLRPGESATVDTSQATVNTNAVVPDSFFSAYNKGIKASNVKGALDFTY